MLIASAAEDLIRFTDAKAERRRLKAMMRAADDRVLDPWERYRALNDHCDRLLDITELYDRKTRFALLILGGLNAINLLVVARLDVLSALQRGSIWLSGYVAMYALLSLCLLAYSIAALRPRLSTVNNRTQPVEEPLLFGEHVFRQTPAAYCDEWRQLSVGQLNDELGQMAHIGARVNATKVHALQRVYIGLSILVALTAAFFVALSLSNVFATAI